MLRKVRTRQDRVSLMCQERDKQNKEMPVQPCQAQLGTVTFPAAAARFLPMVNWKTKLRSHFTY